MNPQDPLAALNALREPASIGWWPLAPGWWIIIALFVVAASTAYYLLHKRYKNNAYRRLALLRLKEINTELKTNEQADDNTQTAVTATNALLKAVALRVYPRHDIAAITGKAWITFLNNTAANKPNNAAFPQEFANAAYQKQDLTLDMQQLSTAAEHWIKTHKACK